MDLGSGTKTSKPKLLSWITLHSSEIDSQKGLISEDYSKHITLIRYRERKEYLTEIRRDEEIGRPLSMG